MPDAPAGTDQSFDLAEDGSRPLQAADFGFSDVDGDGMAEVLVASTPPTARSTCRRVHRDDRR
jgi:hypothetical protein